ncbi:MAG: hypothetical protein IJX39_10225 [Clostridia bacterium]|nr:hypothetical protein [Clostridia bacterium]
MFKKKAKMTPEEQKAARNERISKVVEELRKQIITVKRKKEAVLGMLMDARAKNNAAGEQQARGALRQWIATEKRTENMLMTLELAILTSDLSELNHSFMVCIGELSDVVSESGKKTDVKKTEDKYLKALYASEKQKEDVDRMLDIGKYAEVAATGSDQNMEFDDEIDSMVANAEHMGMRPNRQQF